MKLLFAAGAAFFLLASSGMAQVPCPVEETGRDVRVCAPAVQLRAEEISAELPILARGDGLAFGVLSAEAFLQDYLLWKESLSAGERRQSRAALAEAEEGVRLLRQVLRALP